jgi:hypothetical protein
MPHVLYTTEYHPSSVTSRSDIVKEFTRFLIFTTIVGLTTSIMVCSLIAHGRFEQVRSLIFSEVLSYKTVRDLT